MNLCRDCQHYARGMVGNALCLKLGTEPEPVHGTVFYSPCSEARKSNGGCGPEGRHWLRRRRWWEIFRQVQGA